jgi:hypothetical protein
VYAILFVITFSLFVTAPPLLWFLLMWLALTAHFKRQQK